MVAFAVWCCRQLFELISSQMSIQMTVLPPVPVKNNENRVRAGEVKKSTATACAGIVIFETVGAG